jgi:hypothetical protein
LGLPNPTDKVCLRPEAAVRERRLLTMRSAWRRARPGSTSDRIRFKANFSRVLHRGELRRCQDVLFRLKRYVHIGKPPKFERSRSVFRRKEQGTKPPTLADPRAMQQAVKTRASARPAVVILPDSTGRC